MEANNKAMRDALLKVSSSLCPACRRRNCKGCPREVAEFMSAVRKALTLPSRNCDRFKTKEEAAIAFANEKKQWIPQQVLWELAPWLDWLFSTAKEGEDNGGK